MIDPAAADPDFFDEAGVSGERGAVVGLHHVQLAMPAGGEDAAVRFYEGLLRVPRVEKPEHMRRRGGCWFESGSTRIHLGVEEDFRAARKAHPALLVDDLDVVRRRLGEGGHPTVEDAPLPGYERCYVDDPFGNRIELLQPHAP